jgi:transcriptional regulator GlxA family with amidase domain
LSTPIPSISRHIVLLVYDGFNLLDLSGPLQTFATANRLAAGACAESPYRLTVASTEGGPIACGAGVCIDTVALATLDEQPIDTLLVSGGCRGDQFEHPVQMEHWIARHAPRARRVCSVCTGAFVLAGAGVLQGRRVATHWAWAARLQAAYPTLQVDPAPLFIRDGDVSTSAGVTAGVDLSLALIEEDLGHASAMAAAAYIVVFLKRAGGQSQFSEPLKAQRGASRFESLHAWMAGRLAEPITVQDMAEHASMSPRSFARIYRREVGCTPARMLETLRVEAACRALAMRDRSLKQVATHAGFRDAQSLRRVFHRRLGVPPAAVTEVSPWVDRLQDKEAPPPSVGRPKRRSA